MTLNERPTFRNVSASEVGQETGRRRDKDRSPGYKEYAVRARLWLKRRAKPRETETELPSVIAHDDQHPSISVSHGQLRRPRARLDDRRDGLRRRPGSRTHARRFDGAGLELNRHLDHASSRRSHPGRDRREGKVLKREGMGPGQGRVANSFPRSSGERRGHGSRRIAERQSHRNPGAYARPHRLSFRGQRSRFLRRYAVLAWLRARVRGTA